MAHTFAELLRVFFALRQVGDAEMTQAKLAKAIGVSGPTINNWFTGKYLPRVPDHLDALGRILYLSAFEADALSYAVNPAWVKFGTPTEVLEHYEINRYRERCMPHAPILGADPDLGTLVAEWPVVFKDDFTTNGNHWGLGTRDDGVCRVERDISNGCYRLHLHNRFHWNAYVGGDSNCYAPPVYYLTAEAQRLSGQHDAEDGFGLLFEEINDGCHSILRIRDAVQCFSIYRAQAGGDQVALYQDRKVHPAIRPGQPNRLAILADYERHWFYINDVLVFHTHIARIPDTRLDVAIVSGPTAAVSCRFRNFTVRVPSGDAFINGTPTIQ